MSAVDDVLRALEAGQPVVVPTDTVYGLACRPDDEEAVRTLSALKRRSPDQPIAVVASSIEALRAHAPEVPDLPAGPFTFVVPNPDRRLPWLSGARPDTIGVRLLDVAGVARELLDRAGALAATSANLHGGRDPRAVADIPPEIVGAVSVVLDAGDLPGTPSTVIDLTGPEPRVLREGAVPAAEALRRVAE